MNICEKALWAVLQRLLAEEVAHSDTLPGIQISHLKSCYEDHVETLYQGYQHSIVEPF